MQGKDLKSFFGHHRFSRFWVVLWTVILLLATTHPVLGQAADLLPDDPNQMAAFLDGVMQTSMTANHVPGAVVVVVKDGEVFFAKGYGYADLESRIPVDPAKTLFRPGSVSKLFTWTAVMQLVEAGQLDLDQDINAYLDFEIPATFPEPITMRHLMTHTAGFEDIGNGLFKLEAEQVSSLEVYIKENLPARVFPPGQIGAYSNYGTALSGYIVQRLSGLPFEVYIRQNILDPLSMQFSSFEQPLPSTLTKLSASGYGYAAGEYLPGQFEYIVGIPAGALSASGLDMAKFMIAHLQNGEFENNRILKEETVVQMHSLLYQPDERMQGMAYGFFRREQNGQLVLSHGGDTFLFHSHLALLPEQNLGIFISTNGSHGAAVVESAVNAFMDYYFPQSSQVLTPSQDFKDRAAIYQGSYIMARNNFTSFEKLLSLLTSVHIRVEADQVLITFGGNTTRYIETQPGLLVNPDDIDDRLVLKEIDGQITIHPYLPFVFIKQPWFTQPSIVLFIFVGGLFVFLEMIMFWLKKTNRQRASSLPHKIARWFSVTFGIIYVLQMLLTASVFMAINPIYNVPDAFFGLPGWFSVITFLPVILFGLGVGILAGTVWVWLKKDGPLALRVRYFMLTLFSLAILWELMVWNLLF